MLNSGAFAPSRETRAPGGKRAAQCARLVLDWLANVRAEPGTALRSPADALALELLCRRIAECDLPDWSDIQRGWTDERPLELGAGTLLSGLLVAVELRRRRDRPEIVQPYFEVLRELCPELDGSAAILVNAALGSPLPSKPGDGRPTADHAPVPLWAAGLETALSALERQTHFGLYPTIAAPLDLVLLEGETIYAFRCKDLGLAFRGMRALLYAGRTDSLAYRSALAGLQSLQWSDGTFGDYESKAGDMNLLSGRIRLAFQAIWTMAEMESARFRLVRDMLAAPEPLPL
jgi:hypothetical protein